MDSGVSYHSENLLHLLGGDLKITWDKKENTVYMEGPAETVFTGEWLLKEEN